MEPENLNQEQSQVEQPSSLHQVTPLSKYLAMALFIILPFVGGWIGYSFAPEKVVEVEKEVVREVVVEPTTNDSMEIMPEQRIFEESAVGTSSEEVAVNDNLFSVGDVIGAFELTAIYQEEDKLLRLSFLPINYTLELSGILQARYDYHDDDFVVSFNLSDKSDINNPLTALYEGVGVDLPENFRVGHRKFEGASLVNHLCDYKCVDTSLGNEALEIFNQESVSWEATLVTEMVVMEAYNIGIGTGGDKINVSGISTIN